MNGAGASGVTRRALLVSAVAVAAAISGRAVAYYQIPQLVGPGLVLVKLWITSYDRDLVILARSDEGEGELVDYVSDRLAEDGVAIPVLGHEQPLPPSTDPAGVVLARVRIDLQRGGQDSGPAVLGSAGVMFERDAKLHISVHPRRLFTAARNADDLSAKCLAAAKAQLDLTLIPQLIAEKG